MPDTPLNDDDVRLTNYAIGEMNADEAQKFERLLAESPEARAEVDAIRQLTENLSSEFERELDAVGQQPLAPPENADAQMPVAAAAADVPAPEASKITRPNFWAFGSVAAGLAAMLMVMVYVQNERGAWENLTSGSSTAAPELAIEEASADATLASVSTEPLEGAEGKNQESRRMAPDSEPLSERTEKAGNPALTVPEDGAQPSEVRLRPGAAMAQGSLDDASASAPMPANESAPALEDFDASPGAVATTPTPATNGSSTVNGAGVVFASGGTTGGKMDVAGDKKAKDSPMPGRGGGGGAEGERAPSAVTAVGGAGSGGSVSVGGEFNGRDPLAATDSPAPMDVTQPEPPAAPAALSKSVARPKPAPAPMKGQDGGAVGGMAGRSVITIPAAPVGPAPATQPVALGSGSNGQAVTASGMIPLAGEAPAAAPAASMFGTAVSTAAIADGEADSPEMEEEQVRRYKELARDAARRTVGRGGSERYAPLIDNVFKDPLNEALSTFSIDVDTASYAQVRRALMREGQWPHPDQVRIEELINYFDYDYPAPDLDEVQAGDAAPFAVSLEAGAAPWNPQHRLVRIGLKSAELNEERPPANLVFLLDVSGSMKSADKLALVQRSLRALAPQLGPEDTVTMVAYAGRAGEVLEPTSGDDRDTIMAAIDALSAGGSTNGAGGITLAYQRAREHFIKDGVNRVILATDGDFNVGVSGDDALVRLVEKQAKSGVFLTVLGFGTGNLNDSMMEKITNKGNGNYFYIDRIEEGKKVLVEQMAGTLVTVAKDVKIQVDFNPGKVAAYRLIGYANRMLKREDFDNDKIDAGEIGAGHTVTALYEVVPVGVALELTGGQEVDGLKYMRRLDEAADQDLEAERQKQLAERGIEMVESNELLTVKLRYKQPDEDESAKLEFPLVDPQENARGRRALKQSSEDFRFASAVAAFGMRLRGCRYIDKKFSLEAVAEIAAGALGDDKAGRRSEFARMVEQAAGLEPGVGEDVRRQVRERLEQLR